MASLAFAKRAEVARRLDEARRVVSAEQRDVPQRWGSG